MGVDIQQAVQSCIGRFDISHIIIDGYNIIGIFHKDMGKARDGLIDLLINYKKIKSHDITVVFDGYKNGAGIESAAVRGGVKIIYSRIAEKADDIIKRIITKERREWIVVTSDKDIASYAWSINSIPIPSNRFFEIVSGQARQDASKSSEVRDEHPYKDSEDSEYPSIQKGNPFKFSKKEKAIRRALSKL